MLSKLFRPVDISSTVVFRVAFGAIMLWEVCRYFYFDRIEHHFLAPFFSFKYYGFEWVRAWPGDGMYWHFYVLGALAVLITAGLFYRLASALFFLGFTYIFLLDQALYLNHFYLICLIALILACIPANRAFSLDSLIRPAIRSETVPAWCVWLLRFQVGIPYFFGGIAKLNQDWLTGSPLRDWLAKRGHYPFIGDFLQTEAGAYFFSYGGLLLDLFIVPLLLWRKTRIPAFILAVIFHLTNAWIFNIGIFPWTMIAATTIFFEPDWPRRLLRLSKPIIPDSREATRYSTVALLTLFCLFQILFPLRHFLYPGVVHWTEEGHRFAWHMKLREKKAEAYFSLIYPDTQEKIFINPREFLNRRQYSKMSGRPDMTLQFAYFLADFFEKEGIRPEVYVDAHASLNGRPSRRLIDPEVDLASAKRNLWPAIWILPLEN